RRPAPPYPPTLSLHDALPILARGISTSRARRIGLPPSRDSAPAKASMRASSASASFSSQRARSSLGNADQCGNAALAAVTAASRSEEHTSELQSRENLVCRLL